MKVETVEAIYRLRDEMSAGLTRIEGRIGQTRSGLLKWGAVAAGATAAAGKILDEYGEAVAAIARGTGASGAELERLEGIATRVGSSLRGDFSATAEGLANLQTATGLAGQDLETLTRHLATAAIGMRDDVGGAADSVGRLMNTFGVESAAAGSALIDHLVAASQATGGSMGTLAAQVLRLAPQLSTMGLSAQEAATFVGQLNLAGVPADRVLRSLKTTTGEWAEAGLDVRTMLDRSIGSIAAATTEQDAYRQAVELFGSSAAPGMTAAIRSGLLPGLDDLSGRYGDVSGAAEQVYRDTGTLRDVVDSATNAVIGMAGPALGALTGMVPAIGQVGSAAAGMAAVFPGAAAAVGGAARAMWAGITGPVGLVVAALAAVGAAAWTFRDRIAGAFAAVIDFVRPWVDRFLGLVETAAGWIPGFGDELSGLVTTARGKLDDLASGAASSLREYSRSFDEASPAAAGLADELEGELTPAAEGAAGALTGAGGLAPGLRTTAEAAGAADRALAPLATGVTALGDRLEAARRQTRSAIDALVGSQGLTSGFQQAAAGGVLAAESIGVSMTTTLPAAIRSGVDLALPAAAGAGRDAGTGIADGISETLSPASVAGIFREAFTGGGGAGGAVAGIGAELGGQLVSSLQERVSQGSAGLLSSLGSSFGPLGSLLSGALTGGISAAVDFGLRALGALGGKINEWFGGPDEAELAGREAAESWLSGLASRASTDQSIEALRAGWEDADLARSWIVLRDSVLEAGGSIEQAESLWDRMQAAIREGGDAVDLVRLDFLALTESAEGAGAASAESAGRIVHDAQEIGRQFRGLTEQEAEKLGAELERLGNRAHRGFTLIHSSSLAAGNALANVMLPAVQTLRGALDEAAGAAGRLGSAIRRIPDVPAVPAPPAARGAGFAAGGIARGPDSGYLALLHGTETVIPGAHPGLVRTAPPGPAAPSNNPAARPVQIVIHTDSTHDGRAVARALARHLPAELRRAGVTI